MVVARGVGLRKVVHRSTLHHFKIIFKISENFLETQSISTFSVNFGCLVGIAFEVF